MPWCKLFLSLNCFFSDCQPAPSGIGSCGLNLHSLYVTTGRMALYSSVNLKSVSLWDGWMVLNCIIEFAVCMSLRDGLLDLNCAVV